MVYTASVVKLEIVYKKAQNLRRIREQMQDTERAGGMLREQMGDREQVGDAERADWRQRRHTYEEEELRDQAVQETLVSCCLVWNYGATRRTEIPGARLGGSLM